MILKNGAMGNYSLYLQCLHIVPKIAVKNYAGSHYNPVKLTFSDHV